MARVKRQTATSEGDWTKFEVVPPDVTWRLDGGVVCIATELFQVRVAICES